MNTNIITQICNTCDIEKPLDDFYKNSRNKNGYHKKCKQCTSKHNADPVRAEQNRQRTRKWFTENPERKRAYARKYAQEHVEENHLYYEAHKEEILVRFKERYHADPEKYLERSRRWYADNRERQSIYNKKKHEKLKKNPVLYAEKLAKNLIWREKNRELINAKRQAKYWEDKNTKEENDV